MLTNIHSGIQPNILKETADKHNSEDGSEKTDAVENRFKDTRDENGRIVG